MARPTENATVGYLLWRLTTRLRATVDRALAPLGLTHAQYTLLASLYGYAYSGAQPSQRELSDWTGLEPIFVSKLARALERAGLLERTENPADSRAFQLRLTDHGGVVAERAIAIVQALQEEFTAPIGGIHSLTTRTLVHTLHTLLGTEHWSDSMTTPAATLTGQDVGEAEGALSGLLDDVLARTGSGLSRPEYITLRVLALRGPMDSPAVFHDYLASQPQLRLDPAGAAKLLSGLESRGLISGCGPESHGPVQLTAAGADIHASVADAVLQVTSQLYADIDLDDLATAHNVLVELTQRATRMRGEL
jgi:DNA-binding MarR family transcriptional regulator